MDARRSDLSGKRAVLSGGGSGLGRVTALALAKRGASVIVLERDRQALSALLAEASGASLAIMAEQCDVTSEAEVEQAFRKISSGGAIDLLVNNAGRFEEIRFEALTPAAWREALDINLGSAFLCSRAALASMGEGSCIVNVSSNLAAVAEPSAPAYCVAKAGLEALTRCLALELAERGIRVVAVAPGPIQLVAGEKCALAGDDFDYRAFNPLGRFAEPEEVADAICFAATARYMTGNVLALDGGETANPVAWSQLRKLLERGRI